MGNRAAMLKILILTTLLSSTAALSCPQGWTLDINLKNCYQIVTQDGGFTSFEQGDAKCKSVGGQLASVHSAEENALIAKLSNQGKRVTWTNQTLLGGQRTGPGKSDWKWSDGSTWGDYSNWIALNPDNFHGQPCLLMLSQPLAESSTWYQSEGWDDIQCSSFLNAACKKPADSQPTCPDGWTQSLDYCYNFNTTGVTYDEALAVCEKFESQIVTPKSKEQQEAFFNLVKGQQRWYWLGMKPDNNHWSWNDGALSSYTNWERTEDAALPEFAIKINGDNGKWYRIERNVLGAIACQKKSN